MDLIKTDCCGSSADGAACWSVPAEFVRMRFYYGQRLGPVDLADFQAYLAGKHLFHNLRAHGVGVLCGLAVERFLPAQSAPNLPTTVLRVRRGSALDACGRDIVVGWDQCVDVDAWLLKNKDKIPDLSTWTAPGAPPPRLWVGLRYRECPSDPAPAPRDPCGCDAGGCEFGRVREGFELALFSDGMKPAFAPALFPPLADLDAALAAGTGSREALERALKDVDDHDCPEPPDDTWIALATFTLTLSTSTGQLRVTDISTPDDEIPERPLLLPTAALQALIEDLLVGAQNSGLVGTGPSYGALTFASTAKDQGTLTIPISLVAGTPAVPLAAVPSIDVEMRSFDPAASPAWQSVTPSQSQIDVSDPQNPKLVVTFNSGLADTRYQLTVEQNPAEPVVDQRMRPLRPLVATQKFRLQHQNNDANQPLELAGSLF